MKDLYRSILYPVGDKIIPRIVHLPLLLRHSRVNADRRKVALHQKLVQFGCSRDRLDKDTDLVEFERVQQVVQLAVLFALLQLDVVLLETVQRKLGLIVDVDFQGLGGGG